MEIQKSMHMITIIEATMPKAINSTKKKLLKFIDEIVMIKLDVGIGNSRICDR